MQHERAEGSSHHKASPSPSFSSYSSETLAEIAARVIEELRHSADDDEALFPPWEKEEPPQEKEDFEFTFVSRDLASPVSADDIFLNGQIRPIYPIFGFPSNAAVSGVPSPQRQRRLPLRKLMFEEGETASCSSSTDDSVDLELEGEAAYCVWTPNSVGRERKKSNSTGSASKRWNLRDLLLRSHSEGKNKQQHVPTDHNKRKSFLPYRPDLVGLFANVNGLGRNLRPF